MNKNLMKIILTTMFAAIAAAVSLFFVYVVPSDGTFGLPFYAIPLMIGSLLLGPKYGLVAGFLADLAIGFLGKYGYMPLYTISSLSWSFFAGLIKNKYKALKLLIMTFVSYLIATLGNTLANYIYFGKKAALGTLPLRVISLFIFTPIITSAVHVLYLRLKPNYETIISNRQNPNKNDEMW